MGKTPTKQEPREKPETEQAQPEQPDPLEVLQQQHRAKYEELSKTMISMKQQSSMIEEMMHNTTIQMAEVRGAIQTLERVKNLSLA